MWNQTEHLQKKAQDGGRMERAFARWMLSKGMFYKSPNHDFREAVKALESEFYLVPKGCGKKTQEAIPDTVNTGTD